MGITLWSAWSAAERARQQIETSMRLISQTLSEAPQFPLSAQVLGHMKRLSGAEFLLVAEDGRRLTTLPRAEFDLPADVLHEDWQRVHLGPPVKVEGEAYLCSGIRLRPPRQGDRLYILYPEALWRDKLWEEIRPSLVLGVVALAAVGLAVGVAQRLTRRILELERRTRQIAQGDFSPMPLPRRNDELRDLARSVNEMTERLVLLQETVQRTERLRLLGQVGGGLAHQLRNAVTGARLAVQLYQREVSRAAPDQPPDSTPLEVALRQLTLMDTSLKRFLDLGRQGNHVSERCSVRAILDEVIALVRPQCQHARIALRVHPGEEDWVLTGDPGQLQQLFLNVLGNAVEAAGPGGWVEVESRHGEAGQCLIDIVDSGPGPAAEVAARLFEPFVTGKPEGVGLGLAVARQVAEAHGGSIAYSRQQDRTRFRITLGATTPVPGTGHQQELVQRSEH